MASTLAEITEVWLTSAKHCGRSRTDFGPILREPHKIGRTWPNIGRIPASIGPNRTTAVEVGPSVAQLAQGLATKFTFSDVSAIGHRGKHNANCDTQAMGPAMSAKAAAEKAARSCLRSRWMGQDCPQPTQRGDERVPMSCPDVCTHLHSTHCTRKAPANNIGWNGAATDTTKPSPVIMGSARGGYRRSLYPTYMNAGT